MNEAYTADGEPRPLYAPLLEELAGRDLEALGRSIIAAVRRERATFGPEQEPFRVDPVPRLIAAEEWTATSAGLVQRSRALAAFLADAYGDRSIVAAGRIPARAIDSAPSYEPQAVACEQRPDGLLAGLDLVRGEDGRLRVLEDNTRTPSGLVYAGIARQLVDQALGGLAPGNRTGDLERGPGLLAAALRAAAPPRSADPVVVLVSDGPTNSAWFEHRRLAAALEVPVVTPDDLTLRAGRVHAALDDGGSRPVDVLYRRTEEDRLHDRDGRPTWLAELLLPAVAQGWLTVVNPLGSGLADDKLLHAYVDEMVRFYLAEEPLLESVTTYDLADDDRRAEALGRLDELVVKPRDGYGGEGVTLCKDCAPDELRDVERRLRDRPDSYVAQELVALSTHPTVVNGRLVPRHVDLRPFVIGGGTAAVTAPGALTRVAFGAGEMVVNSSRGGGAKDTWVMG